MAFYVTFTSKFFLCQNEPIYSISEREEDIQPETITTIGIVRLLRDIFVHSFAVDSTVSIM